MKKFILIYLIVINIIAFAMMGIDKRKAIKRRWRIPEKSLFLSAILGGSIGAIAGMQLFRHKTKHTKFVIGMPAILILQIVIIVAISTTGCGKSSNNNGSSVDKTVYEISGDGSFMPTGFSLSGESFELPCTLDDFAKINYVVNAELGVFDISDLQPEEDERKIQLIENYDTINVYLKNDSDTVKSIQECQVYGLTIADNVSRDTKTDSKSEDVASSEDIKTADKSENADLSGDIKTDDKSENSGYRDFKLSNGIGLGTPFEAVIEFYKDRECEVDNGEFPELSYTENGMTITYDGLDGVVKGISIIPS
ncbi:MAG: DUF1294 domain-containing protein [Lachnospiraceae bacterium]|nr:DUF1294 domain-containing protein [Lachnospiraceae bacterium]